MASCECMQRAAAKLHMRTFFFRPTPERREQASNTHHDATSTLDQFSLSRVRLAEIDGGSMIQHLRQILKNLVPKEVHVKKPSKPVQPDWASNK